MGKVTSKLQVTVPKAIADQFKIRPGDELDWIPAADAIRVVPAALRQIAPDAAARLRLFDRATERQQGRQSPDRATAAKHRGWRREDLYTRGRAR
jgi:AbrB family looped-hinge helix DNA binding protein